MQVPSRNGVTLRRGSSGAGVWALQRALNSFRDQRIAVLTEDGDFGTNTEIAVKQYQRATNSTDDGIVGPQTMSKISQSCRLRVSTPGIPAGLVDSLIAAESGGQIAAVNWSVPNGVDCGITQRRIYVVNPVTAQYWNSNLVKDRFGNIIGPNVVLANQMMFTEASVQWAFDPLARVEQYAKDLVDLFSKFYNSAAVKARADRTEYSWRLAALSHNWPWAAQELAAGRTLPDKLATWVPIGTKFPDGALVRTYGEWAKFYAMGSRKHNHAGLVVKAAFGIPAGG